MKRCVLVLVALLALLPTRASAFDFRGAGVKVGTSSLFDRVEFEGVSRLDSKRTFQPLAGVYTLWRPHRRSIWRLVLEADYVGKGYKGKRTLVTDAEPVDVDVSSRYLSVPILGRVLFADDDVSVYAVVGPSVEILLSHDDDTLLDDFKSWALAGNVGLGAEMAVGDVMKAQLEARFNADFTNNYDGPASQQVSLIRHQMLQVTAGIRF